MRKGVSTLFAIVLIFHSPESAAQSLSPFHLSWSVDGPLAAAGGLIGAAALTVSDDAAPLTPEQISMLSREDVNPFDRGATYNYSRAAASVSDWTVAALVAAPLCLFVEKPVRSDWQTYLAMYAETMALTTFSAELVKRTLPRNRPFVYNPEAPLDPKLELNARKSFFSSHSSTAFASAVFLSTTFGAYFPDSPAKGYVWVGSLALATAVGYFRYAAGSHFPTDILAGAAFGSAVGYLIPLLHRGEPGSFSLVPSGWVGSSRVNLIYRF